MQKTTSGAIYSTLMYVPRRISNKQMTKVSENNRMKKKT